MTGGGFGGAVVVLTRAGERRTMPTGWPPYRQKTGRNGEVLVPVE